MSRRSDDEEDLYEETFGQIIQGALWISYLLTTGLIGYACYLVGSIGAGGEDRMSDFQLGVVTIAGILIAPWCIVTYEICKHFEIGYTLLAPIVKLKKWRRERSQRISKEQALEEKLAELEKKAAEYHWMQPEHHEPYTDYKSNWQ